jgi:stage II sporulation protein AB (anti-sigma F factor)
MDYKNKIKLIFPSKSENESFARNTVACFLLNLNPSIEEINDVKTAVSEAVTNSIVHGYPNEIGDVVLEAEIKNGEIHISIFDNGVGIENVDEALEPFFTTKSNDERSGIGFSVMQSFMDEVKVESKKGFGTSVYMKKTLKIGS